MDVNPNYTDELEKFLQSFEENPKSTEENPTQIDLRLFNQESKPHYRSSIKNQNPITDLPTNKQRSILSPINPTPIAILTSSSNNQYYPISIAPMENWKFANPPFNPSSMSIKNDQNSTIWDFSLPTLEITPTLLPKAQKKKRCGCPASFPRSKRPRPFGSDKGTELFSFKLKPDGRFLDAIQALSDIDLNPEKLAMIEVDESGFKLIVQNDSTKAMGILHLKTELLTEFRCVKSFKKLCFGILDAILMLFQSVAMVQYEDVLTVYYTEGSQHLLFKLDGHRKGDASAEIVEQFGHDYQRWQPGNTLAVGCVALIVTDVLKEMIPSLLQSETVTVEMTKMNVMISVKRKEFIRKSPTLKGTGVPEGWMKYSEFEFPHGDSLRKACSLSQVFTVGIQNAPDRVLLQFGVENLGTLLFYKPCFNLLF